MHPLLLCLAILLSSSPVLSQTGPESSLPVAEIQFTSDGPLNRISQESLRKLVVVPIGQPLNLAAARASIKRLFATGLFNDIRIREEVDSGGRLILLVELFERRLIKEIQFKGAGQVPARELGMALEFSEGQSYAEEQVPQALDRIRDLYHDYGFYEPSVEARAEDLEKQAAVRLIIQIDPGLQATLNRFELNVEGGIDPAPIRSLVQLQVGKPYSNHKRDQDLQRIEDHLVEAGYLNPLVYVAEGPRYSSENHSVELEIRVLPRAHTQITFEGLPRPLDHPLELTIYQEGDPSEVFVSESADEIREQLQEKGYLKAEVDYRIRGDGPAESVTFIANPGPKAALSEIDFEGVPLDRRTEQTMQRLLEVRSKGFLRGDRFSAALLSRDQERLSNYWAQQGYLRAQVSSRMEISEGRGRLIFQIDLGPLFRVGEIVMQGNSELDLQRLMQEVSSRPGAPYSPLQLAQDRANLVALYENLGFRKVDVQLGVQIEAQNVNCKFQIEEGPRFYTDEVIVTGNRTTQPEVIRREVPLKKGEPLSLGGVLAAEADLYNLAIFNRVQIRESESFQDDMARTLIVQVEEAPRYSLIYGFGYSSFEGPRGTVGITDNNLLGSARSLSLALRAGARRQRGSLTYSLPRLGRWRIPAVLNLIADNELAQTRSTGPGSRAFQGRPFDSFRLVASAQTEIQLSQRESLFFRMQYQRVRSQVPESLATPLEFFREEARIDLSGVSASYLNESRDNPSDPTRGFLLTADTQIASRLLGSEEELFRFFAQGQYYRPLSPGIVWASALRLGVIRGYGRSDTVPISERFFSGGAGTLRGLPQDLAGPLLRDAKTGDIVLVDEFGQPDPNGRPVPLGGEAIAIFNTEIRFPIYHFVRGVLFYDVGNVYRKVGDLFKEAPTHSLGFGLHLNTPVGPVRLDMGYNPNPPSAPGFSNLVFHLTLGHPF